jgi:hypothetical protein
MRGPEIPLVKRAAVLTFWWFGNGDFKRPSPQHNVEHRSWLEISNALQVSNEAARALVQRTIERAREKVAEKEKLLVDAVDVDELAFDDVLNELHDAPRSGRPESMPKGGAESEALGKLALLDKKHWDMTFVELAKELYIHHARSTIERVMHQHHNIYRRKSRVKPPTNPFSEADRIRLAEEGLEIPEDAIVYSDEMWVEFNKLRRKGNQSRKRGSDPYLQADQRDKDEGTIRIMVWAAIAKGFRSQLYIYDPDDILSPEEQRLVIDEANKILKDRTARRAAAALEEGTEEYDILEAANESVRVANEEEGRTGRHKRRRKNPKTLFKERPVPEQLTKDGINWSRYREKVCEGVLYPFCQQVKAATGHDTIYLIEDNAPAHQTVERVDRDRRTELGIKTLDWPANSPDINKIEALWDPVKDEISTFQLIGASKESVEEAKVHLTVARGLYLI